MYDETQKPTGFGEKLIMAILALFALAALARGADVNAGKPIAFVLCAGNGPPNEFPATVRFANYVEAAIAVGPQIKAAGIDRILYHNPGGNFYLGWTPNPLDVNDPKPFELAKSNGVDVRSMWVNQWLLAEQSACRFANRKHLAFGHRMLREYYGIKQVIYYLGSPEALADAAAMGPACVEMFTACGDGVALAFDATAWDGARIQPGDDVCRFFESLRAAGVRVYVEPRLNAAQVEAGIGKYVDGTIAANDFDVGPHFKPNLAIQPGETIRGPIARDAKLPAGVTGLVHDGIGFNWGAPK